MARLPNPGGDNGTWGVILNDFLAVSGVIDTCDEIVIHPAGGTNTIDNLKVYNQALDHSHILHQMNS